ncbi:MAG: hypothetical protein HN919_17070 [Verrucomicrobia bacterium]|jgi:drug/metabolite transporter (DMT)-like permease|nr:hypothetical protein [Verrucomicrobiota bacterium]MBT7068013.1 hypothetical protein [Verrucomicrobiota bacterium]MBT7698966.1 hypothetical protein [Verrucomicrobiota bacterium]
MSSLAILLVLISAVLHVSWNLLSKKNSPSAAFFLIANAASVVVLAPVILIGYRDVVSQMPPAIWPLLMVSGICLAIYFCGIGGAYRHGDISLSYPIARGLPILCVALISTLRGGELTALGITGMILIAIGALLIPIHSFRSVHLRSYFNRGIAYVLLAVVGTTGYTVVDSDGMHMFAAALPPEHGMMTLAIVYVFFEMLIGSACLGGVVLCSKAERLRFMRSMHTAIHIPIIAGLILTVAYGLILAAMLHVRDVSYIAAFRQVSIPLGAVAGVVLLKEHAYRAKLIGVAAIFAGLLLVKLG